MLHSPATGERLIFRFLRLFIPLAFNLNLFAFHVNINFPNEKKKKIALKTGYGVKYPNYY